MGDQELVPWSVLKREMVLDALPWLRVWVETLRLPGGGIVEKYYQIEQPDYVEIFALVDPNHALGLWRYKHGPRKVNLGLPAGYLNAGELPLDAARRELLEETGYQANVWKDLGSFTVDGNRGLCKAYIYLAQELSKLAEPISGDLEDFRIEFLHIENMKEYLKNGIISTLGAAVAVGLACQTLER